MTSKERRDKIAAHRRTAFKAADTAEANRRAGFLRAAARADEIAAREAALADALEREGRGVRDATA